MRILFLNALVPNYVTDGLFHGLRSIPGIITVDIPRLDPMYEDASEEDLKKTGSRGNTLYKLLPNANEAQGKRTFWREKIEEYDLIIFADIFEQCDLFHAIYQTINPKKRHSLCIIDGYDEGIMFPFFNKSYNLKVRPWSYFYSIRKANYFKREYQDTATLFGFPKDRFPAINILFNEVLKKPQRVFPISMSIPEEHIAYVPLKNKIKDFVNYNVDNDLNDLFPERPLAELGKWQPAFANQNEYYTDIINSRFGVTVRRAGWDCLRHYEYAAKGAILCFKHLEMKNPLCAPFGLNETNCISYNTKTELLNKLAKKSNLELESIQEKLYDWIKNYTTVKVATRFLDRLSLMKLDN